MHRSLAAVGVIAALFVSGAAIAGTDLENFQKQVAKSAPPPDTTGLPAKPKVKCLCRDGGTSNNRVGVLRQFTGSVDAFGTHVVVDCAVPGFDSTGTQSAFLACQNFIALPK